MKSINSIFSVRLEDIWKRPTLVCFKCGYVGAKYKLIPRLPGFKEVNVCNTCLLSIFGNNKFLEENKMKNEEMTTYFVSDETTAENARSALGRLIEYAKFLEKETGRNMDYGFVDTILEEENIKVTTENPTMMESIDDVDPDKMKNLIKQIFNKSISENSALDVKAIAEIIKSYNIDLNSLL